MTVDHADASAATEREPVYPAVEDWVIEYFLPMFRRTLGGEFRWCGQWWQHGEAISRLTALWHAWEVLRLQPGTGIATWYRDYLDQQMPVLMGARGPFYQCSETVHREPHEAAATPAPGGWWDLGDVLLGDGIDGLGEDAQERDAEIPLLSDDVEEAESDGDEPGSGTDEFDAGAGLRGEHGRPGSAGDEPGGSAHERDTGAGEPDERGEQPGAGAEPPRPGGSGPGDGVDGDGTGAGEPGEFGGQPGTGAAQPRPDGAQSGDGLAGSR